MVTIHEDRVLVKPDKKEDKTAGGVILPENILKNKYTGTIVAVGPGRTHDVSGNFIPMPHKVGDKVKFSQFAENPFEVPDDEELYYIMRSGDIIATL